jgi:hypothetical protein
MPLALIGLVALGAALLFIVMSKKKTGANPRGSARPNNVHYEKSEDGKVVYIFRDAVEVNGEVVDVEDVEVKDDDPSMDSNSGPDENDKS